MGWTNEQTETLRTLWEEGHSATMIGRRIGKSRNAVLGKAWREQLSGRGQVISTYAKKAKRRPTKVSKRKTFWTDLRVWQLNKWNEQGLNSVQIASKFGFAVSAASVRMKLGRKGNMSRGRPRLVPARAIPETQHPKEMDRVPFLDVRPNQCRFPLWEPHDKTWECCGNPTTPASPYCEHHMAIAYQPGTAIDQQQKKVA